MISLRALIAVIFLLVSSTQAWAGFTYSERADAGASAAQQTVSPATEPSCAGHAAAVSDAAAAHPIHDAAHDCGCADLCLCAIACGSGCASTASLTGTPVALIAPLNHRDRAADQVHMLSSAHRGDPFRPPVVATLGIVTALSLAGH